MATYILDTRSSCSNIWRVIAGIWPDVEDKISWSLRSGNNAKFWKDKWIPDVASLMKSCYRVIPQDQADFSISNYAQNGAWKWDLTERLPTLLCDKITGLVPPDNSDIVDLHNWRFNTNRCFSLKYAYNHL